MPMETVLKKPLLSMCDLLDSQRIPVTAKDRVKGSYPYYGANGVQDYVDKYIFDDELVLLAEDGGNFGSKDRPIAYRVSGKCWVNNHAHVLKPHDDIDVDYLCYSLMFYNTNGLVNGATRQKLTQASMKLMQIPVPAIILQKEIVTKLKNIEHVIELRKTQLQKLDELVKSRFIEMFGDPNSKLGKYSQQALESICSKINDGEHGSVPRIEKGIIFLNAKNIKKNGTIDWEQVTYIDEVIHNRIYKRCNPEPGDILLTTTGTIGNACIVPCVEQFSMDRGITLVKPNHKIVDSIFLITLLRSQYLQSCMNQNIHASAIGHLFLNKVKKLPVFVPPIDLQNEFADFVKSIDKSKLAIQKSLDDLETLKKSLMQQYFG